MNTRHWTCLALKEAKALVEYGWVQGVEASTDGVRPSSPTDKESRYFCILGALERVCSDDLPITVDQAYRAFVDANPEIEGSISFWNDAEGRTKEDVLAAFDKAITSVAD